MNQIAPTIISSQVMRVTLQPEELRKLASMAGIFTPDQLRKKASLFIKVLLIQHDCLMVEAATGMQTDQDHYVGSFMALSQDRRQLEIVLSILDAVDTDFERASPDAVEAYLDTCSQKLLDQNMGTDRARLEQLFNNSQDYLD